MKARVWIHHSCSNHDVVLILLPLSKLSPYLRRPSDIKCIQDDISEILDTWPSTRFKRSATLLSLPHPCWIFYLLGTRYIRHMHICNKESADIFDREKPANTWTRTHYPPTHLVLYRSRTLITGLELLLGPPWSGRTSCQAL